MSHSIKHEKLFIDIIREEFIHISPVAMEVSDDGGTDGGEMWGSYQEDRFQALNQITIYLGD